MQRMRVAAISLAFCCVLGVVPPALGSATLNGLTLSASEVGTGTALTISGQFSEPTGWRAEVVSACGGPARRVLSGFSPGGAWQVQWDGLDDLQTPLVPGPYRIRVAPTGADGAFAATPIERGFDVTGTSNAFCPNVERFGVGSLFEQALTEASASTATSIIITTATDPGYAAIAASYAHRVNMPLVLLSKEQSVTPLVSLLSKRRGKAVLVGPPAAVSTAVEAAFKLKRVTVVRLSASDRAGTAAVVATRLKPAAGTAAVFAPLGGDPIVVAIASAYANATGLPLLAASRTLPRATVNAVNALQLKGGVAIGDSDAMPDAVIEQLPEVTRIIGKDPSATSFALLRALPSGSPTLVVESATQPDALQLIHRSRLGEPQWLLAPGELSTAARAWLIARSDIERVSVTPRVGRSVAVTMGRLITDRGNLGSLPLLQPKPLPALTVPPSFSFSGSGFGHGVGMSQWGAYGQAKEGRTATEILQHYFSGSVVAPVSDAVDINVSLDSRVQSGSFRLERLSDATSTMELTAADGTVRLLPIGDVVKVSYVAGRIDVVVSGSAPAQFTTTSLTVRWPGNRDSGSASGGPALLRYAGPGVAIANGTRYRYGYLLVTPAKVSGALNLGLQINNVLQLHDEYLYGIAEVSSSWPAATLQAQVITARSYAIRKLRSGLRSACACHIYDDPRDQNFTGYSKLAERSGSKNVGAMWKSAVDATLVSPTQGLALTVGGQVVSAYYSAATGGMTQNNEDVWGGSPLSYTRSVDDPWSLRWASASVSRWLPRTFTQAAVAAAFGAPDVVSIDLSDRYASGAVNTAVAFSSTGQRYVIGAETLKSRLNRGLTDAEVFSRGIPSVWIWKVEEQVDESSAASAALDLATSSALRGIGHPQATNPTVVLLQGQPAASVLATATAYAATRGFGLLLNPGETLDAGVKAELQRRKATRIVFIGDTSLQSAMSSLKLASTQVNAADPISLSARLAAELESPAGTGVVVAASADEASLPIAVGLAARLRRPLLFIDGTVTPEVSAVLARLQPLSTIVVGSADRVPDSAVAGIGTVERVPTGDRRLAALLILSQRFDVATPAVVIAPTLLPNPIAIILAGLGLPFGYADDAVPTELVDIVRRSPSMTLVVRAGLSDDAVRDLRRR